MNKALLAIAMCAAGAASTAHASGGGDITGDEFSVTVLESGSQVDSGTGIAGSAGADVGLDGFLNLVSVDWLGPDSFELDFFGGGPLTDFTIVIDDLDFSAGGVPFEIVGVTELAQEFGWDYTIDTTANSITIVFPFLDEIQTADGEIISFQVDTAPAPEEDTTPPIVHIGEPSFLTCACDVVTIRGVTFDPEGYGGDRLEYRLVDAEIDVPWTFVGSFTSPLPELGVLYNWSLFAVEDGTYYARVTTENAVGLVSTAITTVIVDRSAPAVEIAAPVSGSQICGTTTFRGSISDACDVTWTLEYRATGGGGWTPIDADDKEIDDLDFARWDTRGVPDGTYEVRLRASDPCGNESETVSVHTVFNSGGCASDADLNGDGVVNGADLVQLLGAWSP